MVAGIFLFVFGILLFLNSFTGITGYVISLSNGFSIGTIIASTFFIGGLMFIVASRRETSSLDIRALDTATVERMLRQGKGKVYDSYGRSPELLNEARNIMMLEMAMRASGVSPRLRQEAFSHSSTFNRHWVVSPRGITELQKERVVSYDSKVLKQKSGGHSRGAYRYLFDSNGNYLGIAKHVKERGSENFYQWVD